ncbi:hypothetical protein CHU98_g1181 [Xylaria longipes]|nr:hypothetical protein CHU98_g1181 [Xylaria longipes]
MTTKCWFVLRQTHYPPPVFPETGVGQAKGSLCLGHVIPDLKRLDNVINTKGVNEFPADMPAYPSTAWDLKWKSTTSTGTGFNISLGAPIPAAIGLELKVDAGVAFEKSIENADQFERLETFIIQPTDEYIEDTVERDQVAKYIAKHTTLGIAKSIFMITGIIIARGAKTSRKESQRQDVHGGPGVHHLVPLLFYSRKRNSGATPPALREPVWWLVYLQKTFAQQQGPITYLKYRPDTQGVNLANPSFGRREIPGIVEASVEITSKLEASNSTIAQKRSDFVWAIRLAKISKGLLDAEWSHSTYSKGASFGVGDRDIGSEIVGALIAEGIDGVEKLEKPVIDKNNDVFLLGDIQSEIRE